MDSSQGGGVDSPSLRAALTRRLHRRTSATGRIAVPAVPGMLEEYVDMCDDIFVGIGVHFTESELDQLREAIAGQLAAAFTASPRSEVVIEWESPIGTVVNYTVHAHWAGVGDLYDTWVDTRQGSLFGTEPDAKALSLAVAAGDPAGCPVLDIGAGTGRNALTMARRGHEVDALEMTAKFAAALRREAAASALPLRVIEADLFSEIDSLRRDYRLIIMSEVASDFRSVEQLRAAFGIAAAHLADDGRFVTNVFITRDGYVPDAAAQQLGEQCYSRMFTPEEVAQAASAASLAIESDESVYDFEKAHLPSIAWPPTQWYEEWVTGRDVFDLPRDEVPMELRWLVLRHAS